MAILEIWENRQSGTDDSSGSDRRISRYHARSDNIEDTEREVFAAAGVPALFAPHPRKLSCLLKRRTARRSVRNRLLWEVELEWERGSTSQGTTPQDDSSNDNILTVTWGSETRDVILERDVRNGNDIQNSAGSPFTTPIKRRATFATLSVSRVGPQLTPFQARLLKDQSEDRTNRDTFVGASEDRVLCTRVEVKTEFTTSEIKTITTYNFSFWPLDVPPGAWTPVRVLDRGPFYWEEIDKGQLNTEGDPTPHSGSWAASDKFERKPFIDADGKGYIGFLDGKGRRLGDDKKPVWLEFHRYQQTDFSAILNQGFLFTTPVRDEF